jgi:cell division protein ZapA
MAQPPKQIPQVTVAVNNRLYQVGCEAGQEQHITRLASYIDTKVKELAGQAGQVGDARLLLMASLLIADELADAYDDLESLRKTNTQLTQELGNFKGGAAKEAEDRVAKSIAAVAARMKSAAERLERP